MNLFSRKPEDTQEIPQSLCERCPAAEVEGQIAELDRRLLAVALLRPREAGQRVRMDQILDERNRVRAPRPLVRPSVPVVPGRTP